MWRFIIAHKIRHFSRSACKQILLSFALGPGSCTPFLTDIEFCLSALSAAKAERAAERLAARLPPAAHPERLTPDHPLTHDELLFETELTRGCPRHKSR
jgi:hypothetical protein